MHRSIACVLFVAGALSLLAAIQPTAHAINCGTPGEPMEGYYCVYARHVNPIMTGIYSCGFDATGQCKPHPSSSCGYNGFGIATPGYCVYDGSPSYSVTDYCTENYGSMFVPLHWYGSTCVVQAGTCRCDWWVDYEVPVQYSEQCTCLTESEWN